VKASVILGRIRGIPIGVHYSWLLIAWLLAISLVLRFEQVLPGEAVGRVWLAAIVVDLLFFVTLLAHELSHAVVAQRRGLSVRSITLFALGGVAHIEQEPEDALTELAIGLAGPLASIVMGVGLLALATVGTPPGLPSPALVVESCRWLGTINLVLAAFNLLPGYPLDGGRVLRALLWLTLGDPGRATRVASRVGQAGGFALIGLGVLLSMQSGFAGLWLALVGWFLADAARQSHMYATLQENLRGAQARDLLRAEYAVVDAAEPLERFVHLHLRENVRSGFGVESGGRVQGWITQEQVKEVEQPLWTATRVGDVMQDLEELKAVSPETPLAQVFVRLVEEDAEQLPVVEAGKLRGVVTRRDLLELIRQRRGEEPPDGA
jgi:Zn-dependent protease/predicted transcriptional regulator